MDLNGGNRLCVYLVIISGAPFGTMFLFSFLPKGPSNSFWCAGLLMRSPLGFCVLKESLFRLRPQTAPAGRPACGVLGPLLPSPTRNPLLSCPSVLLCNVSFSSGGFESFPSVTGF